MLAPTTNFPMPIVTPRLALQPPIFSHTNVQEYLNAVTESMNEISPWLPWAKYYPSITQVENYIESCNSNWITKNDNNIGLPLWIAEKNKNKFIGNLVIWNIVWEIPKFELGYWVRSSQTKKGYITEAMNALIRYCFLQLGIRRIEIRCEKENTRAILVPQRLGFELEGVLRNSTIAVSDGKLTDTIIFSRIDLKNLPQVDVTWAD